MQVKWREAKRSEADRNETCIGWHRKMTTDYLTSNTVFFMDKNKTQPELPKDFFKQFKSKEDFHLFFNTMFKQGVEEMLKAELEEHLGYEKHSKDGHNSGNSRNGYYSKKNKDRITGWYGTEYSQRP